ncbi:MAG: TadE/TadG family type IV pilus assembly protein [Collinsella sp.]|nr:TadE/TadG family type IV pilus assembly protein [Collinsella sp.]
MRSMERARSISPCIELVGERHAQSSVEAAILLPSFLMVVLLALQPTCLLYTRAIMEAAAAETARLAITADPGREGELEAFALRRLGAVPDLEIFHAGGAASWDIRIMRSERGGAAGVRIEGWVTPLPVIGVFAGSFGERNAQGDVAVVVEVSYEGRPGWYEG